MRRRIFAEEHLRFRDAVRRYVTDSVVPHYDAWQRQAHVPRTERDLGLPRVVLGIVVLSIALGLYFRFAVLAGQPHATVLSLVALLLTLTVSFLFAAVSAWAVACSDPSCPSCVGVNWTGRGGEHVRIAVADSGPGIPEPERELVFGRFYRGQDAGRRGEAGSGLGLAIVKSLTELHGGRVEVTPPAEGSRARGARFLVDLPGAPDEEE